MNRDFWRTGICGSIFLILAGLLSFTAGAQGGWEKVKQEDLSLYNEPGRNPAAEFSIKQAGGPVSLLWKRVRYTGESVVYECTSPLIGMVNQNTDVNLVKAAFGLEFARAYRPQQNNLPPSWYFTAPGQTRELAEFTYAVKYNGMQTQWYPQLVFTRRSYESIRYALKADRVCRQNKPLVRYVVDATAEFSPRQVRIAGKDYTAKMNAEHELELLEENPAGDVIFGFTDERGYNLNFRIKIDETGEGARCPSVLVNDVKLLRSLELRSDTAMPVLRIRGVLKNIDAATLDMTSRPGYKCRIERRSGETGFLAYIPPAGLTQGVLFRDQYNSVTVNTASLSAVQKNQITKALSRQDYFTLSAPGDNAVWEKDTLFILLNKGWLGKPDRVTIRFTPAPDLPLASLRVNDTPVPGTDFTLPISENGKSIRFELEDSLGMRLEKRVVLQLRDEEEELSVTTLTADSVYRRYLGEGFQAGSNFRQPPPGLERFYLENTRLDLTRSFSFSYRLLPGAARPPALVFKKPGRVDYFSIVFRNDAALFYQQYEDGSSPTLLDSLPFDYRSARDIICSRQNNMLLEGEPTRRDWLLINGRPFRNIDPVSIWSDSSAQVGLGFPEPSNQYRFAQIGLSAHTLLQPARTSEAYTDMELLHLFFTGERGEGKRTKALFEAASRKSFAILIGNAAFRPSPFGDQQPPLPAARDIIDSLRIALCGRFQFDSSRVKVLTDISISDLELLFRSLSGPDYFQRYFGLTPDPGFNLSEVQLLIAVASHGTPDGKLVLADGWDRNLKSEAYLRSLLKGRPDEPGAVFRSVLYVEDICYGTFSEGQSSPLVSGTSASKETLSELYRQGMYDPYGPSFSFHAASYNLGKLSVNLQGIRTFVNTLFSLNVITDYFTDLDLTRISTGQSGISALLLRPFGLEGNNARQDGRFLLLPRDHYKHLPE